MRTMGQSGTAFWAAILLAGLFMSSPAMAHDVDEKGEPKAAGEEKSPNCENVLITIKNTGEGDIKLINVDLDQSGSWDRGPIIFRTISAGGETTWTGNFKDQAGKSVTVRFNTRKILNALTDTYSDMISQSVTISECESESKHEVSFGS